MPNETDFTSDEVSKPGTYHLQDRDQGNQQASVTYMVSSVGKKPLGRGGEQFGIAKRNVLDLYDPILRQKEELNQMQGLDEHETHRRHQHLDQQKNRHDDTACTALNCLYLESPYPGTREHVVKANLQSRAVASSKVDELLGTRILAQEKFGLDEQGKVIGISVGVDGVSVTGTLKPSGSSYVLDIDYSDPQIQKGLSDLEALDYITGQVDRHAGNIFIDPVTKQVRGIDNDLAFPGVSREDLVASKDPTVSTKLVANKPQFLHEETARRIERLTPEELRKTLSSVSHPGGKTGKLAEAEIDGAVQRLEELQAEIVEMRKEGRVVSGFNQQTYDRAIEMQNKAGMESVERELNKVQKNYGEGGVDENLARNTKLYGWESSKKTSYLGTMHVQKMKADLAQQPIVRLKPEAFEEHGITSKIPRSPQVEEYQRLAAPIQRQYESLHREKHMEEYMKLEKQIMQYQSRLDDLQRSGPTVAKFKSLRYGGVENAIEEFNKKLGNASAKLMDLNIDREKDVAARMEVVSERLWDKAVKTVPYENRLEVNNGQGVQNPRVQIQERHPELQEIPDTLGDNHIMREMDNKPKVDLNALREVELEELDVEEELEEELELSETQEQVVGERQKTKEVELEDFEELESLEEIESVDELEELSVDGHSNDRRNTVKEVLNKTSEKNTRNSTALEINRDDNSVATTMGYNRNKEKQQTQDPSRKVSFSNK